MSLRAGAGGTVLPNELAIMATSEISTWVSLLRSAGQLGLKAQLTRGLVPMMTSAQSLQLSASASGQGAGVEQGVPMQTESEGEAKNWPLSSMKDPDQV